MQEPIYKPEQWVTYQQDEQYGGFGKIVGATFEEGAWIYNISGPNSDTTYQNVSESDIVHLFESGSWLVPHQLGSKNGSVYTEA